MVDVKHKEIKIMNKEKCLICGRTANYIFTKKILNKYKVKYYKCNKCNFIQTEKPYWLKEAYSNPIIDSDTGILSRNIMLSKITALIFLFFAEKESKVLDYAGGYGILTRLLRDIGINCFWLDKYSENVFAKNFEFSKKEQYDVITAFEFLEHAENPIKKVKRIFKIYKPKLFIFSTTIHNGNPSKNWWYFAPQGGQHVSFFY